MDISSFRHQSDSRYCFSLSDHEVLVRLACSKSIPIDDVVVVYGDPMTFCGKHQYQQCHLTHIDEGYRYYETIIDISPARLMYVFKVKSEGRECYFCESGLCDTYKFDLGFISAFQFVGENCIDFVKDSPLWEGKVIYQIFPERFAEGRGDKSYVNTRWNKKPMPKGPHTFLGGDLYGVIDKLDYLEDLGVEAIYLTPIHPSVTNHKYDVLDYFDVDERFGGKEAFAELIDKAHRKGMNIMMDLVFNHCSDLHPFFQDVRNNGKASKYYDWFFINGEKPRKTPLNYRCFGYYPGMPKLNTNKKEVQEYLISVATYYAENYHIDGFRLDVSEGVSHDMWIKMKIALKQINPDIILIGENWLNSESYLGPNQFDGVMNYQFLGAVSGYVLRIKDAKGSAETLDGLLMRYKDGHSRMMMNVLASHDVQRFFTLVHADKDLSLLAHAIMMFYWGFPLIYYGEEIFMEGAGDPDNRRGMDWNSKEFNGYSHQLFKELIRLRKNPILKKGDIKISHDRGLLFITRRYEGKTLVLVCNMENEGNPIKGKVILSNRFAGNILWHKGFAIIEA